MFAEYCFGNTMNSYRLPFILDPFGRHQLWQDTLCIPVNPAPPTEGGFILRGGLILKKGGLILNAIINL